MPFGLNNYQIIVLCHIGDRDLCNGDEGSPKWWVDGGDAVRAGTAKALLKRGYLSLVGHTGGHLGVDRFRLTATGRHIVLSAR